MSDGFEILHFTGDRRADVTAGELVEVPLGSNAFTVWQDWSSRPYEVLDVEYDPVTDRSTVHLQFATVDALRAHQASVQARQA